MSEPTRSLTGRRILVVEDEYLIAMEIRHWLREAGAEVIGPVAFVDQALDLIEFNDLDAAALDINLGGGVTAYPVADKLGEIGVPYLFATGNTRVSAASVYRLQPRLSKPYVQAEFVDAVAKLID